MMTSQTLLAQVHHINRHCLRPVKIHRDDFIEDIVGKQFDSHVPGKESLSSHSCYVTVTSQSDAFMTYDPDGHLELLTPVQPPYIWARGCRH